MQPPIDKRIKNPAKYIVELADAILPLRKYGFAESFISSNYDTVVLSSDKCKIKFIWGGWDYLAGYTIAIYFGRTYAVDDSMNMMIDGELYRCWHDVIPVLNYIDMAEPMKIASMIDLHPIIDKYNVSDVGKKLKGKKRQPEWLLHMYSLIMKEYGDKIVEIFDKENPDLWDEYSNYLKQVYDIKGRSKIVKPSFDKIY